MGVLGTGQGGDKDVYLECRLCGTAVPEDTDRCPVCDSTEIASYTFPDGQATR